MTQLFSNAARGELASVMNNSDLIMYITSGGEKFPTVAAGSGNNFKIAIVDVDGNVELVMCNEHTTDAPNTFKLSNRALEGSTSRSYPAGTVVGQRWTAGDAKYVFDLAGVVNQTVDYFWTGEHQYTKPMSIWNSGTSGGVDAIALYVISQVPNDSPFGVLRVAGGNSSANSSLLNLVNNTGAECFNVRANGSAKLAGQLVTNNGVHTVGNISCTGDFYGRYASDPKLKENFKPINNALSIVNKVTGYTFKWKDREPGDDYFRPVEDFGFNAAEFQEAFPMAVKPREDGTLTVDYIKAVAIAFQAITELSQEVKELKERLQ